MEGGAFASCINDLQAVRFFVVAAVIVVLTSLLAKMGSDLHLSFQLRDQVEEYIKARRITLGHAGRRPPVMRMAMW